MEKRTAKVNISTAGGTASKGARTCKVTLPTLWVNALGIDMENRELVITFDGKQIVLSQHMSSESFVKWKLEQRHDIRLFRFYDNDKLCTKIYADFDDGTLAVENHIDNPVKTAFGNKALPTWHDFQTLLEDRCIPRERAGLREYLEAIGVGAYNPIEIIEKTAGRMAEDNQWFSVEVLS